MYEMNRIEWHAVMATPSVSNRRRNSFVWRMFSHRVTYGTPAQNSKLETFMGARYHTECFCYSPHSNCLLSFNENEVNIYLFKNLCCKERAQAVNTMQHSENEKRKQSCLLLILFESLKQNYCVGNQHFAC